MKQTSDVRLKLLHRHGLTEDELLIELRQHIEKKGKLYVLESEFIDKELQGSPSPKVNKSLFKEETGGESE